MATNSNTRKYLIWGSVSVLTITGGVFLFRWLKQRDEDHKNVIKDLLNKLIDKKAEEDVTPPPPPPPSNTGGGSGSNSGGGSSNGSDNPFKSEAELKAFQNYVIDVKKDSAILAPYGADGRWGGKSRSAYAKYGKDYLESLKKPNDTPKETPKVDTIGEALKKDIDYIMLLADKDAPQAKESNLRGIANGNEDFIKNWANAIRARVDNPSKGTTFPFANNIYESYRGEIASPVAKTNKVRVGKKGVVLGNDANLRKEAKYDSQTQPISNGNSLGEIKGFFYNKADKALFAYVPDNIYGGSWKWIHASKIKMV